MDIQENSPLYSVAVAYQQLQDRNTFLETQGNQLVTQLDTANKQIASLQAQLAAAQAAPATPAAPSAHDTKYARILAAGQYAAYLGIPYVFGGEYENDKAFDCSAFQQSIFGFNGITLKRVTKDQIKQGTAVASLDVAQPGDLVFFRYGSRNGNNNEPDHVGYYVGNGQMLHTNDPKKPIRIETISASSKSNIVGIRRFF